MLLVINGFAHLTFAAINVGDNESRLDLGPTLRDWRRFVADTDSEKRSAPFSRRTGQR